MVDETARYTRAFREVDLSVPAAATSSVGAQKRYRRAVLVYQTALSAAGLAPPQWTPNIRGLFRREFIDAMKANRNPNSANQSAYDQAALMLEGASNNNFQMTWSALETVFTALNQFIGDTRSDYNTFETWYMSRVQ